MYIIVGLGNPGKQYENTRHNAGFMAIDKIANYYNIDVDRLKFDSLIGEGRIAGEKVVLVKPLTFMNLSGKAVKAVFDFYKQPIENLIVIYDDIDMQPGNLRIRKSGSSGTHNGMKSIIYSLASDKFPRFRIGIGNKPHESMDLASYVIGKFKKDELEALDEALENCLCAVTALIEKDIDIAMNMYNSKRKK